MRFSEKCRAIGLWLLITTAGASIVLAQGDANAPGPEDYKYIYLTFDDGPLLGSDRIEDAIEFERVPITVLLVGEHGLRSPEWVELYKNNSYIEVGNHSFSHAHGHYQRYYDDPEGVLKDFNRTHDSLALAEKLARLPGRNIWRIKDRKKDDLASGAEAADLLAQNGYSLYGWDLEWAHDPHTSEPIGSAEEVFERIEHMLENDHTFTESHVVLLCHDEMFQKEYEETELKRLIELLKAKDNYILSRLIHYP